MTKNSCFIKATSEAIKKVNMSFGDNSIIPFSDICEKYNIPLEFQNLYFSFDKRLLSNRFLEFMSEDKYEIVRILTEDGKFTNKISENSYFKLRKMCNGNEAVVCDCSVKKLSNNEVIDFYKSLSENGYLENYMNAYAELSYGLSIDNVLNKIK